MFLNILKFSRQNVGSSFTKVITKNPSHEALQRRCFGNVFAGKTNNNLNILNKKTNLHNYDVVRNISLVQRFNKMSKTSKMFMFAFGGMFSLMFLESVYANFKLSGLGYKDFILGREPTTEMQFSDENDSFKTKYASILEKDDIPKFKVSRTVKFFVFVSGLFCSNSSYYF